MQQIEINLPNFDGFYHSAIDLSNFLEISDDLDNYGDVTQEQFDDIDWKKTNDNVSKKYLEMWIEQNETTLNKYKLKIEFVKVDSPKCYNYRTDYLVCKVSYPHQEFIDSVKRLIKDNDRFMFEQLIKDKFTSYDGFISFYSNDVNIWLDEYLNTIDNVIFETLLEFITEPLEDDTKHEIMYSYYELIEYINK